MVRLLKWPVATPMLNQELASQEMPAVLISVLPHYEVAVL